ncbi:hypothetical protein ACYSNW_12015 [Enterococcus sp. LJL99]
MSILGVLADKELSQMELDPLLNSQSYRLIQVKEKEQFEELDGLVVYLNKEQNLPEVIEWLLFSKSNPDVFVWIVSSNSLDREQDILFELGANDVLTSNDCIDKLPYIIKNTFNRVKKRKSDRPKEKAREILNEKNQTVLVNREEKPLTRIEYRMFHKLLENSDTTVDYEELFTAGRLVVPEKIDKKEIAFRVANVVFHLREKTSGSVDFKIETVRSKGYILRLKVE